MWGVARRQRVKVTTADKWHNISNYTERWSASCQRSQRDWKRLRERELEEQRSASETACERGSASQWRSAPINFGIGLRKQMPTRHFNLPQISHEARRVAAACRSEREGAGLVACQIIWSAHYTINWQTSRQPHEVSLGIIQQDHKIISQKSWKGEGERKERRKAVRVDQPPIVLAAEIPSQVGCLWFNRSSCSGGSPSLVCVLPEKSLALLLLRSTFAAL